MTDRHISATSVVAAILWTIGLGLLVTATVTDTLIFAAWAVVSAQAAATVTGRYFLLHEQYRIERLTGLHQSARDGIHGVG